MAEGLYPVHWTGEQAIVALPEHIDVSNAGHIREQLLSVINRGPAALIADMTATISCDMAGANAVVRAYQRAVISDTELRLVVTAQIVSRMLSLSGLDRLVSIYPSLEAATVARVPVANLALVRGPATSRHDSQTPSRRGGPIRARVPGLPAGPPDGNGAAVTRAVLWKLLDALQDGVALADADGTVTLANTRLENMFNYRHAELIGHRLDSLIPVGLQEAQRSHRVNYTKTARVRPIGAGARLVGLRKDGTTFPVDVSFSPVTTAAGHLTLTVVRDITEISRLEDLAHVSGTQAAAEHAPLQPQLLDAIITSLFHVGLSLQAAVDLPGEVTRQRIVEVLGDIDDVIREIRDTAFRTRQNDTPS